MEGHQDFHTVPGEANTYTIPTKPLENDYERLPVKYPEPSVRCFYGLAGELAQLATESSEADPVAVLLTFLSYSAAIFGRKYYLRIGESIHHPRAFVALVGQSSRARKGTSFSPVGRFDAELNQYVGNLHSYLHDPLQIHHGGLSSAEGLIWLIRDESEKTDRNGNPEWDAVHDKRLLIVEEELGNVLKHCQREGNTLSATLRRAWDGGDLKPATKNSRLAASNTHINVLAHITRFELLKLMDDSDVNNGLANRFLWACVRRTKLVPIPGRMDDERLKTLRLQFFDATKPPANETEVVLSQEAQRYWIKNYPKITEDHPGKVGVLTARSEAQLLRLAMLFALLDGALLIDVDHMMAALAIIRYCNASAEYIFSDDSSNEQKADSDKILTALEKGRLSQSDISRLFNRNKSARDIRKLVSDLEATNKIRRSEEKGKGRTTTFFEKV